MMASAEIARKLAAFAEEFGLPDVPRDPALIVGTDVPDELVALAVA
jgi:hypothetical protein